MLRLAAGALSLCSLLSAAPTAEEVLAKARKALGSSAPLKSLSLAGVRRTSVETPDGPQTMTREVEMDFLLPGKFLKAETMELPGGMPGPTMVEALNGETSWRDTRNAPSGANINIVQRVAPGPGGSNDPAAAELARTRSIRANYLRQLLLLTLTPPTDAEIKFDLIGEAEAPDGKAWIIDAAGPDKFTLRLFIDQQTNLPVMASWRGFQPMRPMMIRMAGPPPGNRKDGKGPDMPAPPDPGKPVEVEFEMRLQEHSKQGGLLIPKLMALSTAGKLSEEFEVKHVKVNPNLKAEKFQK